MATRRKLENDIVEVLCCSAERCLPISELKRYLPVEQDKLAETLGGLVRNKAVKRRAGLYCYPIKIKATQRSSLQEKRLTVAQYVSAAKKPLTTGEISRGLGLNYGQVYHICKRFERKGFFKKVTMPRAKPLFFALIIRQIMHAGNYELIMRLNRELREIIEEFNLKDPKLMARLHIFFETMLRQYPQHQKAVFSARKRLIGTIKRAETKGEVLALLGLRPSQLNPHVVMWESNIRSGTKRGKKSKA